MVQIQIIALHVQALDIIEQIHLVELNVLLMSILVMLQTKFVLPALRTVFLVPALPIVDLVLIVMYYLIIYVKARPVLIIIWLKVLYVSNVVLIVKHVPLLVLLQLVHCV